MGIARMNKVSIAVHSSERDAVLKHLQNLSALHIVKVEEENQEKDQRTQDELMIRELESRLNRLDDTISFVKGFVKGGGFLQGLLPQKLSVSEQEYKETMEGFDFEKVRERVKRLDTQMSQLKSEKERLVARYDIVKPWIALNTEIKLLKPTKTAFLIPGRINKRLYNAEFKKKAFDVGLEIQEVDESKNELFAIILFHKNDEEVCRKLFDDVNFIAEDFRGLEGNPQMICDKTAERFEEIDGEIDELSEKGKQFTEFYEKLLILYDHTIDEVSRLNTVKEGVKTRTSYIIEGWVEAKRKKELVKMVDGYDAVEMFDAKPREKEKPPVKLVNRKVFKPFEIVTELYGMPRYSELDPTPLLALFFALFFGLCLTDAGYGVVLALIALFLMKKMPGGRKFLWLIFIGAVFTIIEGALLGGWFGNLFKGTYLDQILKSIMIFDPMKSYFVFYRLALVFGAIQIYWGLIIKLYEEIRSKNYADALIEAVVWLVVLTSGLIMLFASDFCIQLNLSSRRLLPVILVKPSFAVFVFCALIVVIFGARKEKNPVFRLFLGVLRFTILGGIFSYLGDFLSYIRLMALGLVTAGIAGAINDIARMTLGIPIAGVIIFIIILIGGHLFNLGINTLGGFVHTLRLQYVEFFQKFFTGGGEAFSPLRRNEKHIVLKQA